MHATLAHALALLATTTTDDSAVSYQLPTACIAHAFVAAAAVRVRRI